MVHSNIFREEGKLNRLGRYSKEGGGLDRYFKEIVEAKNLKWIKVADGDGDDSIVVRMSGFGLVPEDVRSILSRKMHIEKIRAVYVEVKTFAICGEQELGELVKKVVASGEFIKRDPVKCGEQEEFDGEPAKEFVLYGYYGKHKLKLYKIFGVHSSTYSFELVDKSGVVEKDFDTAVESMISILQSFDIGCFRHVREVVFSDSSLQQPYGRMLRSKLRNCQGASLAHAEALSLIDSNGFIPYADLLSLYSYAQSGDKNGHRKMASKFIAKHHLVHDDCGFDIVKRAGSPLLTAPCQCHGVNPFTGQPVSM